jgi:hypothetical protein
MKRATRAIISYYAALRLSAAAATVVLPDERRERAPIVRAADRVLCGGFDQRELISSGSRTLVVTVAATPQPERQFSPN